MKEQRELNIMQHNWQVTRLLIRQGSVIFGSGLGFGLRGIPKHPHAKKKTHKSDRHSGVCLCGHLG